MHLPGQVAPPCARDRPTRNAVTTQPKRHQARRPRRCDSPTVVAPDDADMSTRSTDRPPHAASEPRLRVHVPSMHGRCTTHGIRPSCTETLRDPPLHSHPPDASRARLARPVRAGEGPIYASKRAKPAVQCRPLSAPAPVPGYGQYCMHPVARSGDGARRRLRRVCPAPEVPASRAPPCAACARPCFTCAFSLAEQWHLHPPFDDRARPTVALHAPSLQ